MTREPCTKRQSPLVPACCSQFLMSMPPRVTRCTQTRPGIRFASAGGTRPEKCLRRSSPTAWADRAGPGHIGPGVALPAGLQFGLQFTAVRPGSSEYAHAVYAAARTHMNPGELCPLKLLILGFRTAA